jgi:hypothetical protein
MARYRIKAPVKNNGPHKFSGIIFVNGEAETDRADQVTYARAQGWELTRLPDPEPVLEPEPKSQEPQKPSPEGDTGEQESRDPEGDQQPGGDNDSGAEKRPATARGRR